MITRTSRELIKNARFLAGLRNSELTDFYTNVLLLNNAYTQVYIDTIQRGEVFRKKVELLNGDNLPSDCFIINNVLVGDKNFNDYRIVNNVFKTSYNKPITLEYSIIPSTLTAPDESKEVDVDVNATDLMLTDNYLYYTDNEGVKYRYDLINGEKVEEDYTPITSYYFNGVFLSLDNGKVVDEKGNEYFNIDEKTIVDFNTSGRYAFVSYSDKMCMIYEDFEKGAEYNYECTKGRKTLGVIRASCCNDLTGKGIIFETNNKLYYGSFVPDTILEWPSNILFQLIEYKLAVILLGLVGLDTSAIEKQYNELLVYFYKTINIDNSKPYGVKKCVY